MKYLNPAGGDVPFIGSIMAMLPVAPYEPDASPYEPEPEPQLPAHPGGNMHQFIWPLDDRAGMDAEALLEKYGIRVVYRHVPKSLRDGEPVGLCVPNHQAKWAEYILCRAGYPLLTPLLDERNRAVYEKAFQSGASRPTGGSRKPKRHGLRDRLWHLSDDLAGPGSGYREKVLPQQQSWKRPTRRIPSRTPWYKRLLSLFT